MSEHNEKLMMLGKYVLTLLEIWEDVGGEIVEEYDTIIFGKISEKVEEMKLK